MAIKSSNHLYEDIVHIANDYLGPAARRFIDHQIQNHFNKPPEKVAPKDLELLIEWIRVAVSLLTEDVNVTQEFTERLRQLTKTGKRV